MEVFEKGSHQIRLQPDAKVFADSIDAFFRENHKDRIGFFNKHEFAENHPYVICIPLLVKYNNKPVSSLQH
jgi:hypothetical protein